jgi:mRNA interferase MazF
MNGNVRRGDIYWIDWAPSRGSEQRGKRPALIIQNDIGNEFSPTTIVATLTTADIKPYPFIVPVTAKESGLPRDGLVNLSAIMTIDKSRLIDRCGTLDKSKMREVDRALKSSFAIDTDMFDVE